MTERRKSCKNCILGLLHDRAEKGEEGQCPICRRGPIRVSVAFNTLMANDFIVHQESDLLEIVKRKKIKEASVGIELELKEEGEILNLEAPPSSPAFELRRNDFKSSTKLNALVQNLRKLIYFNMQRQRLMPGP